MLSVALAEGDDTTRVSLIVPLTVASTLYQAGASGQIALVVLPQP